VVDSAVGRVALLSIHPRFADAILRGEKQVEFRRRAPSSLTHVIVYATAPVQRIVGWFRVVGVEAETPSVLWERFGDIGGISSSEFARYYDACDVGSAIRVAEASRLQPPLAIDAIGEGVKPPQSFRYVPWESFEALRAQWESFPA
jgi:predicted transcriptional regulator